MAVGPGKIQMLRVGGKMYMKPNAAFWKATNPKQASTIITVVGDRWVTVPPTDKDYKSLFAAANINDMLKASGNVTKGQPRDIAGTPAIGLVDHGSDGGTLWVATVGEPYPLRIESKKASDGAITFSDFGGTFTDIKAPAASDVLDLSKIH